MSVLSVRLNGSPIPSNTSYTVTEPNQIVELTLSSINHSDEDGTVEILGGGGYLRLLGSEPLTIGEDIILTYTPVEMPLGFSWVVRPPNIVRADVPSQVYIKIEDIGGGTASVVITFNDFILTLNSETPAEPYVYTNRDILTKSYGKQNIEQWGDYDGTRNLNDIYRNIQQVCYDASRQVDACLAHGVYNTPFELPYPPMIVRLTTLKASDILYTLGYKYSEEFSRGATSRKKEFAAILSAINAGRISLGLPQGGTAPF